MNKQYKLEITRWDQDSKTFTPVTICTFDSFDEASNFSGQLCDLDSPYSTKMSEELLMLSDKEWALLQRALKVCGLNEDTITYIAEQLTGDEYDRLNGFIKWLIKNEKSVGWVNYQTVFREYLKSQKEEQK